MKCVPYFRCGEEDIVSDQLGAFDIRIGKTQFEDEHDFLTHSECARFGDPRHHPYVPQCGRRRPDGIGARIIGFNESESQFGEFPWMVAVLRVEELGDEVVLTAAHCLQDLEGSRLVVRLGEWDTQRESEVLPHLDIEADGFEPHPDFDPKRLRDDVALLFLSEPAHCRSTSTPSACRPLMSTTTAPTAVATGWGKDAFDDGFFQTVLKQIEHARTCRGGLPARAAQDPAGQVLPA
ncbi:phenoloxidase-activating factor 2-like [Pollicipes pollicipes]|uniref:phenoloxidase-activating factor 2-like n=1 Tax=Pollicipes pollicipes TaxID=41117 RepID=UPI0018858E11|nr:phenoloxidase-activating factor 2-like [Pollicipes pollicipes]